MSSVVPSSVSQAIIPSAKAASVQAGGPGGAQHEASAIESVSFSAIAASTTSTTPVQGGTATVTSCAGGCPKDTSAPPPQAPASQTISVPSTLITKTSTLPSASTGACPASLGNQYQYPHLIVPVDKSQPAKAGGTSYNGTVSSTVSSIFNFDIPASDAGKTCTAVFLFPTQDKLKTSSFSLTGSGGFDVALLSSPATEKTSYNAVPSVSKDYGGPSSVTPGNEYVIQSSACPGGQRISLRVSATGSLNLNYFQDFNPSPIGIYITVC